MDDGGSYISCARCSATTALHYDRKENLYSSWNDRAENLNSERGKIADKAREFADHYPAGSDGRNTFVLLAEWIERRIEPCL
jgi:hypothetical protein